MYNKYLAICKTGAIDNNFYVETRTINLARKIAAYKVRKASCKLVKVIRVS
jgi:hypothetical protein